MNTNVKTKTSLNVKLTSIKRVLVIGLDMGDGGLIRYWSKRGFLPNFTALISSGTWIELDSTAKFLHTSAWPTFSTGALPGDHGVYYPFQPKPGHQMAQLIEPDQYGVSTFWDIADAQNKRCLIYDIPETFPNPEYRGRSIFEWGTFAWYGKPCGQPNTLIKRLKTQFGPYPLGFEAKRLGFRVPDLSVLENRLLQSIEYKRKTTQWLLEGDEWDLAVVGFCETHPASHYLWPADADAVAITNERQFQPLYKIYAALDTALGSIVENLPANTVVMITSGDGVRPNHCGWHLLPEVLEQSGYTSPYIDKSEPQDMKRSTSLLGRAKQILPSGIKRRISDSIPWWLRNRLAARIQSSDIDWSQTKAFTLPTDLEGCIRINLKGREPHGIIEPGIQYTELCQEIRMKLLELINPDTGRSAVNQVYLRNEVFSGNRLDHLPDLMVTWNDESPIEAIESPDFGIVSGMNPDPRTGTHSPYGFLLASGGNVAERFHDKAYITDIAPTVLRMIGLKQPSSMVGNPIVALTSNIPWIHR